MGRKARSPTTRSQKRTNFNFRFTLFDDCVAKNHNPTTPWGRQYRTGTQKDLVTVDSDLAQRRRSAEVYRR